MYCTSSIRVLLLNPCLGSTAVSEAVDEMLNLSPTAVDVENELEGNFKIQDESEDENEDDNEDKNENENEDGKKTERKQDSTDKQLPAIKVHPFEFQLIDCLCQPNLFY